VAVLSLGCTVPLWFDVHGRSAEQELTADGLYRVEVWKVSAVYLKLGASFSDYDAVVFDPCTVAYKDPPEQKTLFRREIGNYLLDADSRSRLQRTLDEVFARELDKSEIFRVATEPEPGVLRLSCRIVDFVWEVPDAIGGESFFVHRTGEMTLVMNVADAPSGTLLARIADRRDIRPIGAALGGGFESRPTNNWTGVRDVSLRWAQIVRETLDSLHSAAEQSPAEDSPAESSSGEHSNGSPSAPPRG
jgi:hypothetical protein